MYVLVLVELSADGGVPVSHESYITFNAFSSCGLLRWILVGQYRSSFGEGPMCDMWVVNYRAVTL